MPKPWEKYQTTSEEPDTGPWAKYQKTEEEPSLAEQIIHEAGDTVSDIGETVSDVAGSAVRGAWRPAIGIGQKLADYTYGEDNKFSDFYAKWAKSNEENIEKKGFWTGDLPAFGGEMGAYLVGGKGVETLGAGVVSKVAPALPFIKRAKDIYTKGGEAISNLLGKTGTKVVTETGKVVKEGGKGATGALVGEELTPLTGETAEERKKQYEARDTLGTMETGGYMGIGIKVAEPLYKFGKQVFKLGVGGDSAKDVAMKDMTNEFTKFVETKVNPALEEAGLEKFDYNKAVVDISELQTKLNDFASKTGADLKFTTADMAQNPALVSFFATHMGEDAVDFFKKITKESNTQKITQIIDSAKEQAPVSSEIVSDVTAALGGKEGGELADLQSTLGAKEGEVLPTTNFGARKDLPLSDATLPQDFSRGASEAAIAANAVEKAKISDMYKEAETALGDATIPVEIVKNRIDKFLNTFSGERRRVMEATLPQGLKKRLKEFEDGDVEDFTYDDFQIFKNDLQDAVDNSVTATGQSTTSSQYPIALRDFLTDEMLPDVLRKSGYTEGVALLEKANAANKALRDKAREITPDTTYAAPTVKEIQDIGRDKQFSDSTWLDKVTANKSNLNQTLKAYPDSQPYIENYLLAKVGELADATTGTISKSKLANFRMNTQVQDLLNHPSMSGVKERLDNMVKLADQKGRINVAEAFVDKLDEPKFVDRLWANNKLRKTMSDIADKSGTGATFRNAMRDSLRRKLIRDYDGDLELAMGAFTKNMMNPSSQERKAYQEVFGEEATNTIVEGLKFLRIPEQYKEFGKIQDAEGIMRPLLETVFIKLGLAHPAEATRVGAIFKRLSPKSYQRAIWELQTNPESMTKFLQAAKNPTPETMSGFIKTMQAANIVSAAEVPMPGDDITKQPEFDFETPSVLPEVNLPESWGDEFEFEAPSGSIENPDSTKEPLKITITPLSATYEVDSEGNMKYISQDDKATYPKEGKISDLPFRNEKEAVSLPDNIPDTPLDNGKLTEAPVSGRESSDIITKPDSSLSNERDKVIQKRVASLADDAAKKAGVPPKAVKTFLALESGLGKFDPKNPAQIKDAAWSDTVAKYGEQYGITTGMRDNVAANILMGAHYFADMGKMVSKKMGRQAEPWEVWWAYQMGPGNFNKLVDLMKTKDGTPLAKVISGTESNALFYYDNGKASGKPLNYKDAAKKVKSHWQSKIKEYQHLIG